MKWEVTGADRETGNDRDIAVEAETEDSARRRANRQGVLVASVRAIDPNDSVAGAVVTSLPVLAYAPQHQNRRLYLILAAAVIIGGGTIAAIALMPRPSAVGTRSAPATPALPPPVAVKPFSSFPYREKYLYDAIKDGNIKRAKELLQDNLDLKAADPETGETVLHAFAFTANVGRDPDWKRLIVRLIEMGADPNAKAKYGRTPLHAAFQEPNIRVLVEAGADPNIQNDFGSTPLHEHVADQNITSVLLLYKADPNIQDMNGRTALHIAAAKNASESIGVLFDSGAKLDVVDNDGFTPIKRAKASLQDKAERVLDYLASQRR